MIVYLLDNRNVLKDSIELNERQPMPLKSTLKTPPELQEGEFALFNGSNWEVLTTYPEPPAPVETPPTVDEIAAERYRREYAGITINGMYITTGDRSKTLLNGKVNRALIAQSMNDTTWSANWKVGTNWVSLSAEQIIGIGVAVDSYIQACFDNEGDLVTDLLAGNPVDINSGWPSTEVTI